MERVERIKLSHPDWQPSRLSLHHTRSDCLSYAFDNLSLLLFANEGFCDAIGSSSGSYYVKGFPAEYDYRHFSFLGCFGGSGWDRTNGFLRVEQTLFH